MEKVHHFITEVETKVSRPAFLLERDPEVAAACSIAMDHRATSWAGTVYNSRKVFKS